MADGDELLLTEQSEVRWVHTKRRGLLVKPPMRFPPPLSLASLSPVLGLGPVVWVVGLAIQILVTLALGRWAVDVGLISHRWRQL